MKSGQRIILLAVITALICACNSHHYYDEASLDELVRVLDEEGICFDKTDCGRKGMFFWAAGGWKLGPITGGGVSINVHNVSDIVIAEKIVKRFKLLHSKFPEVPVTVTVFSNAHIDNLHPGTPNLVFEMHIDS